MFLFDSVSMDFTFVLPRNNKELLEDGDCSSYFVKQVYNANEVPTQLRGNSIKCVHPNDL